MAALKNFLAVIFAIFLIYVPNVEAADKPKIMIVNVGTSEDFVDKDSDSFLLDHLGSIVPDVIIEHLMEKHHFLIINSEFFEDSFLLEELKENKPLEIKSSTPLGRAREIALHANCDYLLYGDFNTPYGNGIVFEYSFKNEKFQSLKATIIAHVMEVKTGRIVAAIKGEGISKRPDLEHPENLGKNEISLINFRNATYKAAADVAYKLIKNFPES